MSTKISETDVIETIAEDFPFSRFQEKLSQKWCLTDLLKKVAEEILSETQCGFRPVLSTEDVIFGSCLTLEKCWEQNRNLYIETDELS